MMQVASLGSGWYIPRAVIIVLSKYSKKQKLVAGHARSSERVHDGLRSEWQVRGSQGSLYTPSLCPNAFNK